MTRGFTHDEFDSGQCARPTCDQNILVLPPSYSATFQSKTRAFIPRSYNALSQASSITKLWRSRASLANDEPEQAKARADTCLMPAASRKLYASPTGLVKTKSSDCQSGSSGDSMNPETAPCFFRMEAPVTAFDPNRSMGVIE